MALWPMTEDDYEAVEAEHLDQQRAEEERQEEHKILEHMDAEDTENQDELERRWREDVTQDPCAQLAWEQFEADASRQMEEEAAERLFWGSLPQRAVGRTYPQPLQPRPTTSNTLSFSKTVPAQLQQFIPSGKLQNLAPQGMTKPEILTQHSPNEKPKKLTPRDVANAFCATEDIIITGNAIYWFNGKIYQLMTKEDMRRLIVDKCRTAAEQIGTSGFVEDIFRCIFDEPSICHQNVQPSPDELVFLDGVLNLRTGNFIDHSPKIFATSYLTANYRNGLITSCPKFDRFVTTIANRDAILERRIWEMLGYIFTQDQRGKVFFVLQGPSGSGKSVLGNFMRTCFNKEAVSSLDLHSLGKNFSKADLIGRRICLDLDLPSGAIDAKAISSLKKLTGSDPVTTDVKYMPMVSFLNTAKFIFATNHAILCESADDAFERRIVTIPFTRVIPQENQNFDLLSQLERERDAVIVKALSAYWGLRENHYIFSGDYLINAAVSRGVDLPDCIAQFFFESCTQADVWTPTYTFFDEFVHRFGPICAKNTFSELFYLVVKGACPSVTKCRERINGQGNPLWGFRGVQLRKDDV